MGAARASTILDHLFRHAAGQMVARLARLFGPHRLDLAEEAVQDAICAALETWKFHGVPAKPEAWLMRAAHNRAIDLVRRDQRFCRILGEIAVEPADEAASEPAAASRSGAPLHDDRLALIFSCCHPKLGAEAQLALILKAVCGFGLSEIATAFFTNTEAVKKRITRAKAYLKRSRSLFDLDNAHQVASRLDAVHQVLYLLFNEGYHSLKADAPVRDELCKEAIRLGQLLAADPMTCVPPTDALLAMMYFNLARLPARIDADGVFLALPRQDRARWDQRLIALGFHHLDASAVGNQLSRFHLEAAIAAEHCRAANIAATDWPSILKLYDLLAATAPSPMVTLNQAIARGQVAGPAAGLAALAGLTDLALVRTYPFFHAAVAQFCLALGDRLAAAAALEQAIAAARSTAERTFYDRRRRQLSASELRLATPQACGTTGKRFPKLIQEVGT
jgi:RNA polymerase sigma-70 factor (ECF subfamily)